VSGLLSMRDGRFATPRFNAAVDVAPDQKPGAKLLGESAERKKDFSEISAYRNSITRRGNQRHAAEQRDELASLHVWMAPAWQEITSRAAQKSLAVMCPPCSRSAAGLLALMESANRGLITQSPRRRAPGAASEQLSRARSRS